MSNRDSSFLLLNNWQQTHTCGRRSRQIPHTREVFDLVLGVRVAIAGPGERPRELRDRPRLDIKRQRNWDKKLNGGKKAVASQDHEYLITTDMSLYTQVPAKTHCPYMGCIPRDTNVVFRIRNSFLFSFHPKRNIISWSRLVTVVCRL